MCECECGGGVCPVWLLSGRGGGGGGGGGGGAGGGGGGGISSVVVFRALLLAHRYLSALTTYFPNVGIITLYWNNLFGISFTL